MPNNGQSFTETYKTVTANEITGATVTLTTSDTYLQLEAGANA